MSTYRPPNPPNRPDDQEWPPKQRPSQSPPEPPYSNRRDTPGRPPAEESFSPYRPDQQTRIAERPGNPFPERTALPPDPPRMAEVPPAAPVMPNSRPDHSLADLRLPPSAKIRLLAHPSKQRGRGGWLTFFLVLLALILAGVALGLSLREPEDKTRDEVLQVLTEQGGTAQGLLATAAVTETQAALEAGRTQTLNAMTSTAAAQTQAQMHAPIATATDIPSMTPTPEPTQTEEQEGVQTQAGAGEQSAEGLTAEASENAGPTGTLALQGVAPDTAAGQQVGGAPTDTPIASPTNSPTAKPSSTPTATPEPTEVVVILGKVNATQSSVNVRSGPGTRYEVKEKIANGTEIQVLGGNGESYFNNPGDTVIHWYKIKTVCPQGSPQECEYEGWIASEFVQLDDETQVEQIPVLKITEDYEPPS
ncbi:MAG TPA: SH3 domain-containing protein [Aggregatilineaceae bacterium]|nr:SH3 domain-containing protein [Aggregatilineaceae bacterium]